LIRQREGPAAAHARLERKRADLRRNLEQIQANAPELDARRVTRATAAGDGARLRGLPTIARGVRGAIRGSVPGANLR